MNYKKIYDDLIDRARNRIIPKGIYKESHHIVPVCMKGSNDVENRVLLLAREHCLAHLLLAKIYPSEHALFHAAWMMYHKTKKYDPLYNCKKYEWLKKKRSQIISEAMKGEKNWNYHKVLSEEIRKKISKSLIGKMSGDKNPMWGKHASIETRKLQSDLKKGKNHYCFGKHLKPETKKKKSEAMKGKYKGRILSEDHKQKLSNALKNKPKSEETKRKMRKPKSEEHKRHISESRKGNTAMLGKNHSEETKKKISESNKGKHSAKHIQKRKELL
jgi:hypothetical protein